MASFHSHSIPRYPEARGGGLRVDRDLEKSGRQTISSTTKEEAMRIRRLVEAIRSSHNRP